MRSLNGGKSFARVGAPPVTSGQLVDSLTFANREDGYTYTELGSSAAASLYWTGDGGRLWRRVQLSGDLYGLVTTGGLAYALLCRSGASQCYSSYYLAISSVTDNSWTTVALPAATEGQIVSLAAWGSKVWLVMTPAGGGATRLLVSYDSGRTFFSLSTIGLGYLFSGAIATSAKTLWAYGYAGSMAEVSRSTDGGEHFLAFPKAAAPPGTHIFPISDNEAVFADQLFSAFWRTENGGVSFVRMLNHQSISAVGIASPAVWLALGTSTHGRTFSMWRTTDGGRSWQTVLPPSLKVRR